MENLNIPIFRAKKECDGEYIEFKTYFEEDGKYRAIIKWAKEDIQGWIDPVYVPLTFRIDPTTLSISFPDMLDSQGNKIFASLSEDGKGGDICDLYLFKNQDKPTRENYTCRYKNQKIMFKNFNFENYAKIEIIGIQK